MTALARRPLSLREDGQFRATFLVAFGLFSVLMLSVLARLLRAIVGN